MKKNDKTKQKISKKRPVSLLKTFFVLCLLLITFTVVVLTVNDNVACNTDIKKISPKVVNADFDKVKPSIENYPRPEESTYLTFPEWYIVYSAEEYAQFLRTNQPSNFPYLAATVQYWRSYDCVRQLTKEYPFNGGNHLMLAVIGVSYSAEYLVKGQYESTIGRVYEWLSGGNQVEEDIYAQKVAEEYGLFLHEIPWYEFPFMQKLEGLWRETPIWGRYPIRKWERKTILSLEYIVKAGYGWLIRNATGAVYAPVDLQIRVLTSVVPEELLKEEKKVCRLRTVNNDSEVIILPRYEDFTNITKRLAREGVQFFEIAGNDEILLTVITPASWHYSVSEGEVVFSMPILTSRAQQRIGVRVPVGSLHEVIKSLEEQGMRVEHLYDY